MKNKKAEESEHSGLSRRRLVKYAGVGATLAAAAPLLGGTPAQADDERKFGNGGGKGRMWRAGDHHIHSEYSGEFDTKTNPPTFHKGADAVYPIVTNAIMAKHFGLTWARTATCGCAAPAPTRWSRRPTVWRVRGKTCGSTPTPFSSPFASRPQDLVQEAPPIGRAGDRCTCHQPGSATWTSGIPAHSAGAL